MVARIDEEKGVPLAPETPWEEIDADLTEDHHDEAAAVISRGWSGNESLLAAAIMQTADGNLQTIYAAMIGLCSQVDEFRKVAQTALQQRASVVQDRQAIERTMTAWRQNEMTVENIMGRFSKFAVQQNWTSAALFELGRLIGQFEASVSPKEEDDESDF